MIFTGVTDDSRLAREEIFGPVTCVIKFKTYDEAIDQANDSEYDARPEDGPRRGKNSGLGKEASLEAMLEHFTHKKTLILNMQ